MSKTVLILAPHTDDGEFGCGGTIAKHCLAGDNVHYVAFSAAEGSVREGLPRDILRTEVKAAISELGIPLLNLQVLDFEVRTFASNRQAILEYLVELNTAIRPDIVFQPSANDIHQDHACIAIEGLRAFKKTTLLAYEIPWNNLDFRTTCFIRLDEECVERKIRALSCYESQSHRSYASAEFIRAQLLTRGTQIGMPYAEAFEVVRWVVP